MMESLDYHVFKHKTVSDAATPVTVREHFRQWVQVAPQREQSAPAMRSQRYNFCIHVDEEALQSIISGPPPPADALGTGYVNLVCLNVLGGVRAEFETENTELDRCWMRVTYQDLYAGHVAYGVSGTAADCESLNGLGVVRLPWAREL